MFPPIRHRLTILAAVALAALAWAAAAGPLRAADGGSGLSLFSARVGVPMAIVVAVLASMPALGLGTVAAAVGHPLSGVFVASASLAVLAGMGGPIDDWLRRIDTPAAYGGLIVELLIWNIGLMALLVGINVTRPVIRRWASVDDELSAELPFTVPRLQGLAGGLVCAMVGGALAFFLIRSSDGGQVIWSLMVAFAIGALLGQMAFPDDNTTAMILAPALVGVTAYVYVLVQFNDHGQLLQGWYTLGSGGPLPGLAVAMPIHYVSAAVVGCTLGVGAAQGLDAARGRPATA